MSMVMFLLFYLCLFTPTVNPRTSHKRPFRHCHGIVDSVVSHGDVALSVYGQEVKFSMSFAVVGNSEVKAQGMRRRARRTKRLN